MLAQMRKRVLIALVVSAAVVVASCSPEPSASPTPAATQVAGATATPGAESATPPSTPASTSSPWPVSTVYASWNRVDLPERVPGVINGNRPEAVTWFGDRYVAVGGVIGSCCTGPNFSTDTQALVWRSPDGVTWNLVPDSESFDQGHMRAVAATDTRIVAVGTHASESTEFPGRESVVGATWSSTDGRSWRTVWGSVPSFVDVVATDDGFLAATEGGRRPAPAIWRSVDGLAWTRVAAPIVLGDGVINRLIRTADGFLAVGASVNVASDEGSGQTPRAAAWFSVDGLVWERIADQPAFDGGVMTDVAFRNGQYLAAVFDPATGDRKLWISDDGRTWQGASHPASQSSAGAPSRIVGLPSAFLLSADRTVGGTVAEFAAWTTVDGTSWAVVPDQPALEGVSVYAFLETEGGALAVGSYFPTAYPTPVAWSIH